MKIASKLAGAIALAGIITATTFGASGSGAIAQDQAEQQVLEPVQNETTDTANGSEPAIRFVMSETVQELPAEQAEPARSDAASLGELVAEIDTSGEMSREVTCLAQAVYFESRGEPLDGQLAVATVIINRAESDVFPDDYCSVVTQRSQFSFVRGGRIPAPNRSSVEWQNAQAIARIAHRDLWDSAADDALFFHARYVSPSWARRKVARTTIENHIFYR